MRKRRNHSQFGSIRVEGQILPADLLQRVSEGDKSLGGLNPTDYHLIEAEKISEATNRSWNRMLGAWVAFKTGLTKLPDSDTKTTLTRDRWLLPLFQEFGYGRLNTTRAISIDGKSFAISHLWGSVPIHLVGSAIDLDSRTEGVAGAARMTPHGQVQELLNRSDDYLWGFVSNGFRLRVLRDNSSLTRQAFVEFDLEAMMEGEAYSDFVLLWLMCHQSRVEAEKPEECWLEKWSKTAQEQGTRALDQLRNGVTTAISALGSGFISHLANRELKEKLRSGALDKQDYYRELLRLVYRLLFIFVAEDRNLLLAPDADRQTRERYTKYYSTSRIRSMAGRKRGSKHPDLYYSLRLVMQKLGSDEGCPELGLPALGSFLFSPEAITDIESSEIANADIIVAIRALVYTLENGVLRSVDYKNLGSEELGSVYESLLELHPDLNLEAGVFELRTAAGNERKTTGSYYTPSGLIQCLLDSALDPVLDEAIKKPDPERALLSLKICDPACGSGHFLIAASHRLAKRVAMVRTGEIEPSPDAVRSALRQVISKCVYGVDINPMSVELCKVALWMEALDPGKPLSFLDHHIQCGNSLIGVTPRLLKGGIPDAAFDPIEGDDKVVCSEYKKRNKKEREGQQSLFSHDLQPWDQLGNLSTAMMSIDNEDDGSIGSEHRKQERYERLVHSSDYEYGRLLADMWCAAFMWKKTKEYDYPITEELFRRVERSPHSCPEWMKTEVKSLAAQYLFFHWHISFPDVFRTAGKDENPENEQLGWVGGFDCVLGNPPWERVKLQEEEFFASRDAEIANARTKSDKKKLIKALPQTNPSLARQLTDARRIAENTSKFVRVSSRFPLTGIGDVNTYALFSELALQHMSIQGTSGIVVKTAIGTADTYKVFFEHIIKRYALVSLLDFENSKPIFVDVAPIERFCLLTITSKHSEIAKLAFFLKDIEDINDELRQFSLTNREIDLLNPNTHTCPVFRTFVDAALSKLIYTTMPVMDNESTGINLWRISFLRMFDMTNDAPMFSTYEQLRDDYKIQCGAYFRSSSECYVPLYEAKLLHQYNHRHATFAGTNIDDRFKMKAATNEPSYQDLQDSKFVTIPRYWVPISAVKSAMKNKDELHQWCIAFRNTVQIMTNTRCSVFCVMPMAGVGNSAPVILTSGIPSTLVSCLLGSLNSLVFDYLIQQSIGGGNLNFYILKQLPLPPPSVFSTRNSNKLVTRILELTYTAWDIKAFADDLWKEADEALRQAIMQQWDENQTATGGHEWNPSEWAVIDEDGIKLPPFKWDEDRRAVLRAELDAYYAKLYGLNRKQLRYVLDPHGLSKKELEGILDPWEDPTCSGPHLLPAEPDLDFPGETFRVLKNKEEKQFGEYRTRRLVLEAWERLHAQGLMPEVYDKNRVVRS
ncbi:MAG: Eco57I restriction-modification methylase domain-containing protein [Armatimonadota bacterium]